MSREDIYPKIYAIYISENTHILLSKNNIGFTYLFFTDGWKVICRSTSKLIQAILLMNNRASYFDINHIQFPVRKKRF